MRAQASSAPLIVQATASTLVVLLGWSMQDFCDGLMGFAIERTDHEAGTTKWIKGQKTFAEMVPGPSPGKGYSSRERPVQSFQWADYSAKSDHHYSFRVVALKGTPGALTEFAETRVDIATQSEIGEVHTVYFNRGVAASQEYARGKKLAIKHAVAAAVDAYGRTLPHRFGLSDDDPANVALAIAAMRDCKISYPDKWFFVIDTNHAELVKLEVFTIDDPVTAARAGRSMLQQI